MASAATIPVRPELVAACGLYCGSCRSYLKGNCPGCAQNAKATWCKVRTCNLDRKTNTCAQCTDHTDPVTCSKFHNPIARAFGFIFNTNRTASIRSIREIGLDAYAQSMADQRRMGIRRRGK